MMLMYARSLLVISIAPLAVVSWTVNSSSRRQVVHEGVAWIGKATTGLLVVSGIPSQAQAARGAAELDFEYYIRSAVSGNKREGNVLPSLSPTPALPRTLKEPLLSLLLNDDCSASCVPIATLVQTILQSRSNTQDSNEIERNIQQRLRAYREKARKSFYAKAPWENALVSDQYYFDLTSYALWRTAADLLPNFVDRDRFIRGIGRDLLNNMQEKGLLPNKSTAIRGSATSTIPSMQAVLQTFTSSGFCRDYRIGEAPVLDKKGKIAADAPPVIIFDDLDDDALTSGASIDCLVSVLEPATLGASLQITGEQSRFGPDFVGATLSAVWEQADLTSSWEVFFVDPEYRPNPKDYFPNEQLLQYTISLKQ
jgi:hypothetical protein